MRRAAVALLLLLILPPPHTGAGDAPAHPPAPPMTNEDVVRMTMSRWSAEKIVGAIRSASATAFDLDPEVVAELREAGVAEPVIQAMKDVTRATPDGETPSGPASPAQVTLRLRSPVKAGSPEEPPVVQVPSHDPNGRPIQGALLLVCTDPRHVPDGWIASPFGADLGRNHVLWHARSTDAKEDPKTGLALMTFPSSVDLTLEAGEHPIALLLALRVGDEPWGTLAHSEARLTVDAASPVVIHAEVSGRLTGRRTRTSGFACRLTGSEPPGALTLTPEKKEPQTP